MKNIRDLLVWQKSMDLAVEVYQIADQFPRREMFGLSAQIKEAAVSVPSNVAEGQGRLTRGEWLQFLGQARGSLYEVDTQTELAFRLAYIDAAMKKQMDEAIEHTIRPLNGLIAHVRELKKNQR